MLGCVSLQRWVFRNIKLIHFWLTKAIPSFGKFNLLTEWARLFKDFSELMIHTARCKVPSSSNWLGPTKRWLAFCSHPLARVKGDWNKLWKSNVILYLDSALFFQWLLKPFSQSNELSSTKAPCWNLQTIMIRYVYVFLFLFFFTLDSKLFSTVHAG